VAIRMTECEVPAITTDCKGILDSLAHDPHVLTQHDKALARTWMLIRQRLDGDWGQLASRLKWMPSHGNAGSIGHAVCSDGKPVTAAMWRANRLADVLAKTAAEKHRVPATTRLHMAAARQLVRYAAAKLGVVTHRAGNHVVQEVAANGELTSRTLRDSTAKRPDRHKRLAGGRPQPGPAAVVIDGLPPGQGGQPPHSAGSTSPGMPAAPRRRVAAASLAEPATKRRAVRAAAALAADRLVEAQLGRWLADWAARPKATVDGPTAAERMEAMRQRVRSKAAAAAAGSAV